MEQERKRESSYDYNSEFPTRLRALMENKNGISPLGRSVSQTELSKAIGVTRQAVSTYALGTSAPDIIKLRAISDFFHVSSDFLLGLSSTRSVEPNVQEACAATGLDEKTIGAIHELTKSSKGWFTFSQLIQTEEFANIIDAISCFLSIRWKKKIDDKRVLEMDAIIQRESGGSMRVVSASTEKYLLLISAQNYLSDAIKLIDKKTDPTVKNNNGEIWRIENE